MPDLVPVLTDAYKGKIGLDASGGPDTAPGYRPRSISFSNKQIRFSVGTAEDALQHRDQAVGHAHEAFVGGVDAVDVGGVGAEGDEGEAVG